MAQYRRICDIILLMQESEGRKTELRYLTKDTATHTDKHETRKHKHRTTYVLVCRLWGGSANAHACVQHVHAFTHAL
jgi:hypothetical protein